MVWFQFSTKVLQITIVDIDDWGRMRINIKKKIHLYIIKNIHDIINPKHLQKEREKNF